MLPINILDVPMADLPTWVMEGGSQEIKEERYALAMDRLYGYRGEGANRLLNELDALGSVLLREEET
jgi:hypothetical protein